MADFGAERETLLANPEVMAARKRLDEAIHEYGKDMKLAVITVPNAQGVPVQVLEVDCLVKILGNAQAMMMDMKREVTVMGSVCKILTLYIDESVVDEVSALCADVINKHAENIEKAAVKKQAEEKKSSIITNVAPSIANKIKKRSGRPDFGRN